MAVPFLVGMAAVVVAILGCVITLLYFASR